MADVREAILARLLEVVAAIPNMRSAYRNNVDITEDQLPAVIVLDGDEESDGANDVSMKQPNRPYNVQMTPGILVQVQDANAVIGSVIATFRSELIKRVLTDTELNEQIVKTGRFGNGAIRYLGCQTDVGWSRTGYAALTAQFLFKYALKPEDL
ncbi:MAG TPA: hypothetical protein VMT98_16175 [Verrucomicrobiae bacterium]|nr:hypothetical protein [Verrucomicrobiae bacterium]